MHVHSNMEAKYFHDVIISINNKSPWFVSSVHYDQIKHFHIGVFLGLPIKSFLTSAIEDIGTLVKNL